MGPVCRTFTSFKSFRESLNSEIPQRDAADKPIGVPRWKQELLSRPLRRVVAYRVRGRYWIEILDCGHRTPARFKGFNEPRRHVRCRQCAAN